MLMLLNCDVEEFFLKNTLACKKTRSFSDDVKGDYLLEALKA